jgi:drug/metabolite transporter (DMT)-like permease
MRDNAGMPQLTAQPRNRLWLAYALLALAPAMMSVNYVVSRAASGEIDPHLLALVRWSTALLLMLPLAWRELAGRAAQWRAQWRNDLLLGALGMWICGAWVYQGAHTTSAAISD